MKKTTFREKLLYWFDGKMSGGSLGLIKLLTMVTIAAAVTIACILHMAGVAAGEADSFASELWNSFASILNSWFPSFEDGWMGYVIMMSLASIFGLLVTSVLIGIISTAMEEKIESLKKGNVRVMEENHIVVLGFEAGEYALIQELVAGADKRPCCIVLAAEMDREKMEDCIRDNVKCPKNVRILCRSIDIFDPLALERCSISSCRTVLITPTDNDRTVRLVLAVTRALYKVTDRKIRTIAVLSKNDYRIPHVMEEKYGVMLLRSSDTIAKIMAHSCTQPGLSKVMLEMFHFDGSEMHIVSLPGMEGLTFEELVCRIDDAAPMGIYKGKELYLNPDPGMVVEQGDRLLVFCEESDSARLTDAASLPPIDASSVYDGLKDAGRVVIIGYNPFLATILYDLPENVGYVTLANVEEQFRNEALEAADKRESKMSVTFFEKDVSDLDALTELAKTAEHIVVLCPYNRPEDSADLSNIFMIMSLRDIRDRLKLNYNITTELKRENNQNLLIPDSETEFVVSSNMSSLFLAQLSESPDLLSAFNDLLTNEGSEIYLKEPSEMHCGGEMSVLELRRRLLSLRYLLIGVMKDEGLEPDFNLTLSDRVCLNPGDKLIVLGEN